MMNIHEYYEDRRVLITGSAGFIGSALMKRLHELKADVYPFDIKHGQDVTDRESLLAIFQRAKPEVVYHLAAFTEVAASVANPADTYKTNILGTLNVLEACRLYSCESVVVASSDKVYGLTAIPFSNKKPDGFSTNPYGASKQYADHLCDDYRTFYELPVTALRLCNVFGPGQGNVTTLITNVVRCLLLNTKPVVYQPDPFREWLYIDDAVEAYLWVGIKSRGIRKSLNVGSGDVRRPSDVVRDILKLMEMPSDFYTLIDDESVRKLDYHQCVDSSWFQQAYPLWQHREFDEALRTTVEWYVREFNESMHTEPV